eukprot:1813366-Amphidinium_carterae.2
MIFLDPTTKSAKGHARTRMRNCKNSRCPRVFSAFFWWSLFRSEETFHLLAAVSCAIGSFPAAQHLQTERSIADLFSSKFKNVARVPDTSDMEMTSHTYGIQ